MPKSDLKSKLKKLVDLRSKLVDVYNYCQFDSIQQTKLQTKLGLLVQMIQMSALTKVPLKQCVFNAVTTKVEAVVTDAYFRSGKMYIDEINPFARSFEPTPEQVKKKEEESSDDEYSENKEQSEGGVQEDSVAEDVEIIRTKKDKKYLKNIGGDVQCYYKGFQLIVSAIDASAMYPGQKEANNIDKCCFVLAEDMLHILKHKKQYKIKDYVITKLIDMFSPYKSEKLKIDFDDFDYGEYETVNQIGYSDNMNFGNQGDKKEQESGSDKECSQSEEDKKKEETKKDSKMYRWQIEFEMQEGNGENKVYKFQQFFFRKKNQHMKYSFCFLLQDQKYSPKAQLLTSNRNLRNESKKKMKEAKDEGEQNFYNCQQLSYKLINNSEYGANDYPMVACYNMFESSLVTKQARYTIQFARDTLHSPYLKIPKGMDLSLIDKYNKFLEQGFKNPEVLTLKINNIDKQNEIIEQLLELGMTREEIEKELVNLK